MPNFVYIVSGDHHLPAGVFENHQDAVEMAESQVKDKVPGVHIVRFQRMTKAHADNVLTASWNWDGSEVVYYNKSDK